MTIRRLHTIEEYREAQEVQPHIWAMEDRADAVPLHLLITAQKNGGLVLGAFIDEQMVGYLFGFLGTESQAEIHGIKHCSHMMGVVSDRRGRGIGEALKRRQRQHVLRQGLDLITWTYDPLEGLNAYLNIAKLGAVCQRYRRSVYGKMTDKLNSGLPTDRFEVEWWIRERRVKERLAGDAAPFSLKETQDRGARFINETTVVEGGIRRPSAWLAKPDAPYVLVEIPEEIRMIKERDMDVAREWRYHLREVCEYLFEKGWGVTDFVSETDGDERRNFYVLERIPEE